jgi:hypothetical protein
MACGVESVLESDPGHGDGTAFQRDGGIEDFDPVNRRLIDEHDHSKRWFPSQNQRQHTFGQAGGIKVWALQKAFEVHPLGQGDGGEVETSVAEADTQVEPEEGTGQAREVLSDGTPQLREICLNQSASSRSRWLVLLSSPPQPASAVRF